MKPEEWALIREQYFALMDVAPGAREALLEAAANRDPAMAASIRAMLRADSDAAFLPSAADTELISDAELPVLKDYLLLEELGRGGMGIVYRAKQRSLPRIVAIKLLRKHAMLPKRDIARFHREAAAIAKLRHPNIVTVYGAGKEGDFHYFAMEFVEGTDLSRILRDRREAVALGLPLAPSPLPDHRDPGFFRAVARIGAALADALETAHKHQVLHRDVKPSNILLSKDLVVKLVDFGIARDTSLANITLTDELIGTPDYMSPEQVSTVRASADHRTDVYSLGAVMYEMLTLNRPYEGTNRFDLASKISGNAQPPRLCSLVPAIPKDLEVIVETAMNKNIRSRYGSAEALRNDLWRFLSQQPIVARPPSVGRRISLVARQAARGAFSKGVLVTAIALFLAILGTTLVVQSSFRTLEKERDDLKADAASTATIRRQLDQLSQVAGVMRTVVVSGARAKHAEWLPLLTSLRDIRHPLGLNSEDLQALVWRRVDVLGRMQTLTGTQGGAGIEDSIIAAARGSWLLEAGENAKAVSELERSLAGLKSKCDNNDPLVKSVECRLNVARILRSNGADDSAMAHVESHREGLQRLPDVLLERLAPMMSKLDIRQYIRSPSPTDVWHPFFADIKEEQRR